MVCASVGGGSREISNVDVRPHSWTRMRKRPPGVIWSKNARGSLTTRLNRGRGPRIAGWNGRV
jgi:hypothetical protein